MSATPATLNPTLADLLSPSPDLLFLIPTLLLAAAYAWGYTRAHREGRGQDWPAWKAALFALGVLLLLITTLLQQTDSLHVMPLEVAQYYASLNVMRVLPIELPCTMDAFGIIRQQEHLLSPGAELLLKQVRLAASEIY